MKRVIINVPSSDTSDSQFEFVVGGEADVKSNVLVYQDGHLAVAIENDGRIQIGVTVP